MKRGDMWAVEHDYAGGESFEEEFVTAVGKTSTLARPLEAAPQTTSFRSTPEQDKIITALISVGAFSSRTDAIKWLLDQGIAAKQDLIQQALETHKQIEHLRKGVKFEDLAGV